MRTTRHLPNPEEQLMARCQGGDLEAFALIYARYEQRVFRYAYHLLGHRKDADDVKQETFFRAYQAIRSFRSSDSVLTWLLRICSDLCRSSIRSWEGRKVCYRTDLGQDLPAESLHGVDAQGAVERSHMLETIHCALRHLSATQREIVVLHDLEDLDYRQISAVLGCSPISAKMRLLRARRALQARVSALLEEHILFPVTENGSVVIHDWRSGGEEEPR